MRTSIRQRLMFCFAAAAALTLALCSGCSDENIGGAFMERGIKNTPQYKLTVKISPSDDCGSVSLSPEKPNSTYLSGTIVYLTADENSGYKFKNWSGVSGQYGSTATVTMDGNKAVTAVFEAATYTVTLSNAGVGASGSGEYAVGATVSITAGSDSDGKRFKNWTTSSAGVTFANSTNATTTFTMPANDVTVSVNFDAITYAVTVTRDAGSWNYYNYAVGTTVSISAGTPPDGQQFKNWTTTSNGVVFADANSPTTTFTMPANEVTVKANFEQLLQSVVDPSTVVKNTFTDSRNYKEYKTVKIGSQTWMAENLNYETASGSWCYGEGGQVFIAYDDNYNEIFRTLSSSEIQANCNTYGRLYTWDAAMTACPNGWTLPSRTDWDNLASAVGGVQSYNYVGDHHWLDAGKKLKSKTGWSDWLGIYNDSDDYGFSALPGGCRSTDSTFHTVGDDGIWWTATGGGHNAYYRYLAHSSDTMVEGTGGENFAVSVRCVADD